MFEEDEGEILFYAGENGEIKVEFECDDDGDLELDVSFPGVDDDEMDDTCERCCREALNVFTFLCKSLLTCCFRIHFFKLLLVTSTNWTTFVQTLCAAMKQIVMICPEPPKSCVNLFRTLQLMDKVPSAGK